MAHLTVDMLCGHAHATSAAHSAKPQKFVYTDFLALYTQRVFFLDYEGSKNEIRQTCIRDSSPRNNK